MLPADHVARIIPELERELPTLLRREGIPGAAIAIVAADSTVWAAGFGVTDRECQPERPRGAGGPEMVCARDQAPGVRAGRAGSRGARGGRADHE